MTTTKTTYESVKTVADRITEARLTKFVDNLQGQLPMVNGVVQWKQLEGMEIPATTVDNWLRRAQDAARLDGISLNRAAFEVWKRLEEVGAKITGHENCQIVPSPDIESKLARAVEKGFAQKPRGGK